MISGRLLFGCRALVLFAIVGCARQEQHSQSNSSNPSQAVDKADAIEKTQRNEAGTTANLVLITLQGSWQADKIAVNALTFSPDGAVLATAGSDKRVKLWQTATQKMLRELTGHSGFLGAVAISNDNETLASSGTDRAVKVWNTAPASCSPTIWATQKRSRRLRWPRTGLWPLDLRIRLSGFGANRSGRNP